MQMRSSQSQMMKKSMICFLSWTVGQKIVMNHLQQWWIMQRHWLELIIISVMMDLGIFARLIHRQVRLVKFYVRFLRKIKFPKNVHSVCIQELYTIQEYLNIPIQRVKQWNMQECYLKKVFQVQRSLMRLFIRKHLYKISC